MANENKLREVPKIFQKLSTKFKKLFCLRNKDVVIGGFYWEVAGEFRE